MVHRDDGVGWVKELSVRTVYFALWMTVRVGVAVVEDEDDVDGDDWMLTVTASKRTFESVTIHDPWTLALVHVDLAAASAAVRQKAHTDTDNM